MQAGPPRSLRGRHLGQSFHTAATVNYDTDGNGTAGATDEFVELYNSSDIAIDISGLELRDQITGSEKVSAKCSMRQTCCTRSASLCPAAG